jgi:hypothetical protein
MLVYVPALARLCFGFRALLKRTKGNPRHCACWCVDEIPVLRKGEVKVASLYKLKVYGIWRYSTTHLVVKNL